ncbi:hypothetical protein DFR76_107166 [Nocardia pseudobrasiliensis]|uniref:Uncharacterized protein n=1 Tax=Nocardia pseudobrasiliensis TaxID=45979 RepID=A0A370I2J9_9NOCA|nr:hypothetical protein DFR76_107166 [Nocardia pseudobrasiliensis]
MLHIDQTADFGNALLAGDNSRAAAAFDENMAHMMHVADTLSQGIITQFPDAF